MENKTIIKEQIETWKKKHRKIYFVNIEGRGKFYFKEPSTKVLKLAYASRVSHYDDLTVVEIVLRNCYLGGDVKLDELLSDVSLFGGIAPKIHNAVKAADCELGEA